MFASSMDVETASYALLTYAFRGEFRMGIPILKWLTSKQNILGLYSTAMVNFHFIFCQGGKVIYKSFLV